MMRCWSGPIELHAISMMTHGWLPDCLGSCAVADVEETVMSYVEKAWRAGEVEDLG